MITGDETIFDYFRECLGRDPEDETLKQLKRSDPCGRDCAHAITTANALIACIERGFGDDRPELVEAVVYAAEECVSVFWRG